VSDRDGACDRCCCDGAGLVVGSNITLFSSALFLRSIIKENGYVDIFQKKGIKKINFKSVWRERARESMRKTKEEQEQEEKKQSAGKIGKDLRFELKFTCSKLAS
jgi:hypothetical protein